MAEVHITNNFYGSVGQQIDHIDHQEVHFDKDMQMHVASDAENHAESPAAEEEVIVRFPFFISSAPEQQKMAFEKQLCTAAPLGPRAVVDAFNRYHDILDIRYRRQTIVHRLLRDTYGLTQEYDAFNAAMRYFCDAK